MTHLATIDALPRSQQAQMSTWAACARRQIGARLHLPVGASLPKRGHAPTVGYCPGAGPRLWGAMQLRPLSCRLPRYQHDNASRGLLRYCPPNLIEQALRGLVVLFNIAELLPGRIRHGPFDLNGLLATARLPQGDNRMHAVGPDDNPVRHCNTPACKLPLDGSGERCRTVARRAGD